MGRFFFPALPALAVLLFYGLRQYFWWAGSDVQRVDKWLAAAAHVGMIGLTVTALWGFLRPAYAQPASFAANSALPNASGAQFDSLVKLRGYEVEETAVSPGEPLDITLYWEVTGKPPGNYIFFAHLIDNDTRTLVGQRDTHPGLGNFPSSQWEVGDRFVEKLRLYVPETAYSPAAAQLSIGFYAPEGYRLGVSEADGAFVGDALVLETVTIEPSGAENANEINVNFNNKLNLVSYAYNKRVFSPGDVLDVRLLWEPLTTTPGEFVVSVRLRDETGQEIAIGDGRFPNESSVIPSWSPGQFIEDRHLIYLDPSYPPGVYSIHVQLIDTIKNEAENILAEDGHVLDNRLSLSSIRIEDN
jgi:hypothetical protein